MDQSVADIIGSADGPWAIVALLIIAIFLLAWKYGGALIKRLDAADARVEQVQTTLGKTNHGSQNHGEAIDRLTDLSWQTLERLDQVSARLNKHLADVALQLVVEQPITLEVTHVDAEQQPQRSDAAAPGGAQVVQPGPVLP